MTAPVRLSVRHVVEFALRCGDLDSGFSDSDAMAEGARAHRRIQKSMGPGYQSEVTLSEEVVMGGIPVLLQGRADGVFEEDGVPIIDEIKSTFMSFERFEAQAPLHLGQGKCYAYMLLKTLEEAPAQIGVQLTYVRLDDGEVRRRREYFSPEALEGFMDDLCAKYGAFLAFQAAWKLERDVSIAALEFPFSAYRSGQRELAVAVYRTVERAGTLFAEAPTGIGKTLSALFPSVKAMGEGKAEKLFYLTAKTVTRAVAEDAAARLAARGLRMKTLSLRAKDKICVQETRECTPEACPCAKGHYDRVNTALLELLRGEDALTPGVVSALAEAHKVCPYELSLDAALFSDLIVCDYNHAFDPVVYLRRFFGGGGGNYVFLIDEAHNLVERAREMYSAELEKRAFSKLKTALKGRGRETRTLRAGLEAVNRAMLERRRDMEDEGERRRAAAEADMALTGAVFQFCAAADQWLAANRGGVHPLHSAVLELYFSALAYTETAEHYSEHYVTLYEAARGDFKVTQLCLDPSGRLEEALKRAKAAVFFSATLSPLAYYKEILGGGEEAKLLRLGSPFHQENLLLLAHRGISTRYKDRERSLAQVAEALYTAAARGGGNIMAFFPSYDYMQAVHRLFAETFPEIRVMIQENTTDEAVRAGFLAEFREENTAPLLGFCVMGGVFSEGIDLVGRRLSGAVIIGVGLPKVTLRTDLIRTYFDEKNGGGFDYAYVFPGMNKVMQAAGRVIRTESDRGFVLLIDDRFGTAKYRALYPEHWRGMRTVNDTETCGAMIEAHEL
ncbi:ATP-dependent DNA helicase [Oscillospiraceae bacterium OttesenSCG-928-F05]|nr:ATP-dependent DNA helicase [Oscillospiraceae bacterium OttesenSCG-928-F05]